MQAPSSSDGIQRLLAAEQEAQAIIAKARKAKSERLKQAKAEAEKELAVFKAEREEQYKKRVAENSTSSEGNLKKLTADADAQIASLQTSIAAKKQEVLSFLVGHVATVKLAK